MQLTFYGGAKHVTGAHYLLEAGGLRLLIDCGLVQGSRFNEELNYEPFPYGPPTADALFITHSHADHMGRIPKLCKEGFSAPIYTSEPTAGLIEAALPDTLHRTTEDARDMNREPLFDEKDMEQAISLLKPLPYGKVVKLNDRVSVIGRDSAHILGSTAWEFTVQDDDGTTKRIAFPGDIGNPPSLLLKNIEFVEGVDYTLVESAYGSRHHEARSQRREMLLGVVKETAARGGVLMIPSFAIERTQELLLEIDALFEAGDLPKKMPVFVDSPLAIRITEAYGRYSRYFNERAIKILRDNRGLFQFPWLTFTPTVEESKRINDVPAPKIIIAGSGMSQGGRILHHERRYLSDPKSSILFVGYQVEGSLGRLIRDKATEVTMFGETIPIRCHVHSIGAYSAHADQDGLIEYLTHANKGDSLKKCFVVQGERESADALAARAREELGIDAIVPDPGQSFTL